MRAILHDFGLASAGKDMLKLIETLNAFLLQRLESGTNVALLIDEAQNLSLSSWSRSASSQTWKQPGRS